MTAQESLALVAFLVLGVIFLSVVFGERNRD